MKLIDERTEDGSRRFAQLPLAAAWDEVCQHLLMLPGVEPAAAWCDKRPPGTLDFRFGGHQFRVHRRQEELSLLVCDPLCSDLLLFQIAHHLGKLFL
jgi:hypothetical protein